MPASTRRFARLHSWLNENVKYITVKYVAIKAWQIALVRYVCMVGFVAWFIVYKILYLGEHLATRDISGTLEADLIAPRHGLPTCDPESTQCTLKMSPLQDLPYCLQSASRPFAHEDTKRCRYGNIASLFQQIGENSFFIATHGFVHFTASMCQPDKFNNFSCANVNDQLDRAGNRAPADANGEVRSVEEYFYADIDRYILNIDHSFHTMRHGEETAFTANQEIAGGFCQKSSASDPEGACDWRPSLCVQASCAEGSLTGEMLAAEMEVQVEGTETSGDKARVRLGDYPMLFWQDADILTVRSLLKLAGVNLDSARRRDLGVTLEVLIEYGNRVPWVGLYILPWRQTRKAEYTYYVSEVATMPSRIYVKNLPTPLETGRMERAKRLYNKGIILKFSQGGELLEFDWFSMLITVSAVTSLWVGVQTVLDLWIMYVKNDAPTYMDFIFEMKTLEGDEELMGEDGRSDFTRKRHVSILHYAAATSK